VPLALRHEAASTERQNKNVECAGECCRQMLKTNAEDECTLDIINTAYISPGYKYSIYLTWI
jgi:hypothetical protein